MHLWRFFLGLTLLLTFLRAESTALPSENAFTPAVEQKEGRFFATISLSKDVYLLDDSLELSISGDGVELESVVYPDSVTFEDNDVFWDEVVLSASVKGEPGAAFELSVMYEGCMRGGGCSGLREYKAALSVPEPFTAAKKPEISADEPETSMKTDQPVMEQDIIAQVFEKESLLIILATFFGFGLLLSFTPCVFPMIPILSSLIVCSCGEVSAKRGFYLSLVYVLAMSAVYAVAGVLAALSGASIQAAFQVEWVIVLFSGVFIALALAMFGLYDLQMPNWLQAKLSRKADCSGSGGIGSIAVMGVLSALIIGPCVAAPLAGALLYIGQSGDVLLGGLALFVMSMGMGVPLLVIGAGAGRFMPKPGPWMDAIKNFFGLLLLGVAISLLSRILSEQHTLMAWAVLFMGTGLLMGAFDTLPLRMRNFPLRLKKAVAAMLFIYGLILAIGAFAGATSMMEPLKPYAAKPPASITQTVDDTLDFKPVLSPSDLQTKLLQIEQPMLLYFTAQWCSNCKELKEKVFSQSEVIEALKGFDLYRVDVTANTDDDIAFMKQYKLFGPPGIVFYDLNGKELSSLRMVGYKDKKDFLHHIALVKSTLAQKL